MSKAVVMDTNAYTAFMQGKHEAVQVVKAAETIVFSPVVMGELLGGFSLGKKSNQNRRELRLFMAQSKVVLLSLNGQTAECYAQIYQQLRTKGQPIPTNDMWIAALAIQLEISIFTYDVHFSAIEGLKVIQKPEDFLS